MEKGKIRQKAHADEMNGNSVYVAGRSAVSAAIRRIMQEKDLSGKKELVRDLERLVKESPPSPKGDSVAIVADSFCSQIAQMLESRSPGRLDYYAERLLRSLSEYQTPGYSDINLRKWHDYGHIKTDSLWIYNRRGTGEGQDASYWGNFIPEIPQQLIERYTRKGEWVLDPFIGSGTTMVESIRAGRNCIGIDINADATSLVRRKLEKLSNPFDVKAQVIDGDSRHISRELLMDSAGTESVQLAILHPPYHDIVKFSDLSEDLSNAGSLEHFMTMFREVMDGVDSVLDPGRFLCIVIGDKYEGGELIPLSHLVSGIALGMKYRFKGIIVKNFEGTRGKRGSEMLWRYRALAGGFYVFKHEYILVFRKR